MVTHLEGKLVADQARLAIVVARWNDLVTSRLLAGALDTLRRHGLSTDTVTVVHVPGSFELPAAAHRLAGSGRFDGVICLGAVIQGQTQHHDYINHAVAQGLVRSSLDTGVPIAFGVLTCESMEQALDRAGGKAGNKGDEAALAVIEMINLFRQLPTT